MEESSLLRKEERIKFSVSHHNASLQLTKAVEARRDELIYLSSALALLEKYGAAPILPDGKVGGNAALLLPISCEDDEKRGELIILAVSKSGKKPGEHLQPEEFCFVNNFDSDAWAASYSSADELYKPSSDTPLLWASLIDGQRRHGWQKQPRVALHGHALADDASAERLNLPISSKETLFSTPEDVQALESLFKEYPYPEHQIFLRKNHGFFLLADSVSQAQQIFKDKILPYLPH